MKKLLLVLVVFGLSHQLMAQFEDLHFGSDSTLDVITWNIEHFPKNGQITLNYVADIIIALDADVVAMQEFTDESWLDALLEKLDGWQGYYAMDEYASLSYVYKTSVIENAEFYEIYTNKDREFPRSPLVLEMDYSNEHYVIINNHYKCCGNGSIDFSNPWDEETRRYDASVLIDEYISANLPEEKVIVLGDLNDILTDSYADNVFRVFIDNPTKYLFVDMDIAEGSNYYWSYPTWPSHLDHILITDEIFEEYENDGSATETIRLDDYFSSWNAYDNDVSDHRPVGIKIKTNSSLSVNELAAADKMINYPNPFNKNTTISIGEGFSNAEIVIYNVSNQIVSNFVLSSNQVDVKWDANGLPDGFYYAKLVVDGSVVAYRKMILIK